MINSIRIQNFKSIVDLKLDLGRFNVLIGENGSGKSNILEGIGFAAAASDNKLDYEFLTSRGIRNSKPELFKSAFTVKDVIKFNISLDEFPKMDVGFELTFDSQISNWKLNFQEDEFNWMVFFNEIIPAPDIQEFETSVNKGIVKNDAARIEFMKYKIRQQSALPKYLSFAPENTALREFSEPGQILPLGIKGEGLFKLLKDLIQNPDNLEEIKEYLQIFDWFEDFHIPTDNFINEYRIQIKDRFLEGDIQYFDQRSANEGFLFMLFYVCLFISDKTPSFFAIDNIEASFNPKLCAQVIGILNKLAKKHNKQVIITTHNPAVLDGLNLNDKDQKLFAVRRNLDGHTLATNIKEKPKTTEKLKLSEMWMRGLLGGLPKNF